MSAGAEVIREQLIIFTRFPEPGMVKTRLIPALGAEGAADLQRALTEHIVAVSLEAAASSSFDLSIRFDRGSAELMREWLGDRLTYAAQPAGDLGRRLALSFDEAFAAGAGSAVIIGSDIPGITARHLRLAFSALRKAALVLGPARDGGYYLIGLRQPEPRLFQQLDWGGKSIFAATRAIAKQLDLSVCLLPPLDDIDQAADLPVWNSIKEKAQSPPLPDAGLSVIVPALNEEERIAQTLASVFANGVSEAIVVDGGSQDNTVDAANAMGATVLAAPRGRGTQLNAGAAVATGDILLFLHADTLLPEGCADGIAEALADSAVSFGAFRLKLDGPGIWYRFTERAANLRSRWLQLPYGDQALFMRRESFAAVGGFPDWAILEDVAMVCALKKMGRLALLPAEVATSIRRWQNHGKLNMTIRNSLISLGYLLGLPHQWLAAISGRDKHGAH